MPIITAALSFLFFGKSYSPSNQSTFLIPPFRPTFIFILFGIFLAPSYLAAQGLQMGAWRPHFSYSKAKSVAITENYAYAACAYSAFRYDLKNQQLEGLSKQDGFSETVIAKIGYCKPERTLVVAYTNGNIDFIKDGVTTNLGAIAQANITGSKRIRQIVFDGSLAFLAADFGVVVLNVAKQEVKESNAALDPSSAGSPVPVIGLAVDSDSLYLATTVGLKTISRKQNMMDSRLYRTTALSSQNGLPDGPEQFRGTVLFRGKQFAYFDQFGFFGRSDSGGWDQDPRFPKKSIRSALINQGQLLICLRDTVVRWHPDSLRPSYITDTAIVVPEEAAIDPTTGDLYIADSLKGLTQVKAGVATVFKPAGPTFDLPFKLMTFGPKLYSLSGGYDEVINAQLNRTDGYGIFQDNSWTNIRPFTPTLPFNVRDINTVLVSPTRKLTYFCLHGGGLLTYNAATNTYGLINDTAAITPPTSLRSTIPLLPGDFMRLTDIKEDKEGNIWVLNHTVDQSLHKYGADGNWKGFTLIPGNRAVPVELVIDDFGTKFIRFAAGRSDLGSIVAYNETNEGLKERDLNTNRGDGGLPSKDVYDIVIDKEGAIIIATGLGLGVIYNSFSVFDDAPFDVNLPIFDGRPILENDVCTALAIDGGNRKWVGTRNSGLYLFNKDLTQVLRRFTKADSPLPSDNITEIAINGTTGEVFIVTDEGMVSYRADATEAPVPDQAGKGTSGCTKVFPNPIRPDFEGVITIECLPENAFVKITDAAGRLVAETKANGGTATWNGRSYTGKRLKPGMYLVYASTQGTNAGIVAKIAMIR